MKITTFVRSSFLNVFKPLFFLGVIAGICVGCSPTEEAKNTKNWMNRNGKIKLLSTTAMIDALVKEVAGSRADTETLISGQLDPHSYQLVKGDDEKLEMANLIFSNGLGLEHGPSLRHFLSESPKTISLGDLLKLEEPDLFLYYNGTIDPHIWMDMSLWVKTIKYIVEALSKNDQEHASEYAERGKSLEENLNRLHEQLLQAIREVPESKRYLITSHDAFNYFSRAYLATEKEKKNNLWQDRFAAPEGLAPESQLSTTDIRNILNHMKKYQIQVVFPESNVSRASIKKLMDAGKEMGIPVIIASDSLYGDAMGPPGSPGDTYPHMIQHNVNVIIKYLK